MNISRRALLGGVAAIVVTPVAPSLLPPTWVPNPASNIVIEPKGEIFYGGAAGGGKMDASLRQFVKVYGDQYWLSIAHERQRGA